MMGFIIFYFLYRIKQSLQIGPDLWAMVTAAIIFLLFSQLMHLSFIGARSYRPKALLGLGTSGPGTTDFKLISF